MLWGHAASVGEVEGIAPLVRRWRDRHPKGVIVVSTSTDTGRATARRLLPGAEVRLLPLDFPFIASRVVRRVRPSLFVFSENELWPNLLWALRRAGTPVVQVSGRMSTRAAATLSRFPLLGRAVLQQVSLFCVQAEEHRSRLLALGVAPERVVVTGSLKAARPAPAGPPFLAGALATGRPLIVAGLTHAGEEEALLEAAFALRGRRPAPLWILAPRHPERFDAVAALLERRGVASLRRSRLPAGREAVRERLSRCDVLLLDTLGELAGCYREAAVAFVGGTLVPVGGHNLLEPARVSVPVVVGSNLDAVAGLADELEREGAAAIVRDGRELRGAIERFLDARVGEAAGRAARAVAERHMGTLAATWAALEDVFGERAVDSGRARAR